MKWVFLTFITLGPAGVCAGTAPAPAQGASEDEFSVTTHKDPTSRIEAGDSKEHLKLVSWRLKKDSKKLDVDRIASLISAADIAIFQDIEFNERGETAINVIANLLEKRIGTKVCRAWFKFGGGERGKHGFCGVRPPSASWKETVSSKTAARPGPG
ncbi:MAG: hypothetical protein HC902_09805 [Calothrix sp. SM1_5_4]|nr:hypothetical protein [Calothrix sp. SM1_5_4]